MMRLLKHYLFAAAVTSVVVSWQIEKNLELGTNRAHILLNDGDLDFRPGRESTGILAPELGKFQRPDAEPLKWYLTPERTFVTCITWSTAQLLCDRPVKYAFRYISDLRATAIFLFVAALLLTFFTGRNSGK